MTILSLIAVGSSLLVVTAPNTVISVLWLVVVFITTSILLGLIGLGYAALLYVIVYVGAIAIIFLFVVQLLGSPSGSGNNFSSLSGIWNKRTRGMSEGLDRSNASSIGSGTLPIASVIGLGILYIIINYLVLLLPETGHNDLVLDLGSIGQASSLYDLLFPSLFSSINSLQNGTQAIGLSSYHIDLTGTTIHAISNSSSAWTLTGHTSTSSANSVYNLAEWLYGGATLPLIIASIVLLLAMIAPIVLCNSPASKANHF